MTVPRRIWEGRVQLSTPGRVISAVTPSQPEFNWENGEPYFLEHGSVTEFARARSLAILAGSGVGDSPTEVSLAGDLTENWPEWKDNSTLKPWVDLFDGASQQIRQNAEAATRHWMAAANATDATPRVRGLAYLGLANLAIVRGSNNDAAAALKAADGSFDKQKDIRGHAAVLILSITAATVSRNQEEATAAAKRAETFCRKNGLLDGVVESLLAASVSEKTFGSTERAARDWRLAEDGALRSGLMPVRLLTHAELLKLKHYAKTSLGLPQARAYYSWAMETGDLLLIERSSRAVAARAEAERSDRCSRLVRGDGR